MRPGEFLHVLWDGWCGDGAITLWTPKKGDLAAESLHLPVGELPGWTPDQDAEFLDWVGERDCYFHPALRVLGLDASQRGGRKQLVALAGFGLDVDLRGGVHKADAAKLPTEADLPRLLEVGPDPTLVVHSGGGIQPWYLFETVWALPDVRAMKAAQRAAEAFQAPFHKRAAELGFHLDNTAGIERQWRLPGTKNWKRAGDPRPVEVIYHGGDRIRASEAARASVQVPASAPVDLDGVDLEPVRAAMKRIKPDHQNKAMMKSILAGKSFAEPGDRDFAMQRACSTIAWLTPARALPAEVLAEIMRPSLSVWAAEPDAQKTLDEEVAKATEKFERAIAEREEKEGERRAVRQVQLEIVARGIRARSGAVVGVTEAAEVGGDEGDLSGDVLEADAVIRVVIVQYRGDFYAHCFGLQDGFPLEVGYHGPFKQIDFITALKDLWENAPEEFSITHFDKKGDRQVKTLPTILYEYGVAAHKLIGHLALQKSYFDVTTRTFHRAFCPIRVKEAVYDSGVDEWLHALGGKQIDQLLDWLACVPRLERENSALYLQGDPNIGKSGILARGIARLWRTSGPARFQTVMGSFNADMFECPFILLDEGLPKESAQTSAFIRSLVGSSEHTHNQKFDPAFKIMGCVRLMIAANNDRVLSQLANEELSDADVEAVAGRFLHIEADSRAAEDFIIRTNAQGREIINSWIDDDVLAKHVLWLTKNRTVVGGRRFLVDGEATEMHRALIIRGEKPGLILEWLAKFALDPKGLEQHYKTKNKPTLAYVGNGQLLVNTQAVVDCWEKYLSKETKKPSSMTIGRTLTRLSHKRRQLGTRGDRMRFHLVNYDNVRRAAEDLQLDLELMDSNLKRAADFEPEPEPKLRIVQ